MRKLMAESSCFPHPPVVDNPQILDRGSGMAGIFLMGRGLSYQGVALISVALLDELCHCGGGV